MGNKSMITQTLTPDELARKIHADYNEMKARAIRKAELNNGRRIMKEKRKGDLEISLPPYSTHAPSGLTFRIRIRIIKREGMKPGYSMTMYVPYLTRTGYGAMVTTRPNAAATYNAEDFQWYTPHFFDRYRQRGGMEGMDKLQIIDRFFETTEGVLTSSESINLREYENAVTMALPDGGTGLGEYEKGKVMICRTYLSPNEIKQGQEETVEKMQGNLKRIMNLEKLRRVLTN